MNIKKKIGILGASNLDITGFPEQKLHYGDANIGVTKTSAGGVGRNIAENLVRLGFSIDLISVFGDDVLSKHLQETCEAVNLTTHHSIFLKNATTATFLAIMDHQNDLAVGISAMDIYEQLSPDSFQSKIKVLQSSDIIVLETNFPDSVLEYITHELPDKKFILDTVSGKKALRCTKILDSLYILKTNLLEARMLAGNELNVEELLQFFIKKGVKNIFITLGKDGVAYANENTLAKLPPIPSKIINTIGAGDSFVSGIIYADSLGLDIHKMALYGMASASINVQYNGAVSPEMTVKNLEKKLSDQ